MSNGSELAHPLTYTDQMGGQWIHEGLTKREAFAMAAMQGIRASMIPGRAEYADVALMAVNQADYLLAELEKSK